MSDAVTALNGAHFDTGIAEVSEAPVQGMITLRGDLSRPALKRAATEIAAVDMPRAGEARLDGNRGILWMSPDELLVLCPYDEVPAALGTIASILAEEHALAVNVSDARAMFRVAGSNAREVLSKLCPVDFTPGAFGTHSFRRTRMAQVAAAVWMPEDDVFHVMCFRSVAKYAFDLLSIASQQGSEVGYI